MTLLSTAQELFVMDPSSPASQLPADDHSSKEVHHHHYHDPELDVHEPHNEPEEMIRVEDEPSMEVSEPIDVEIIVEELPGAPEGTRDPEPLIQISDGNIQVEEKDDNDAKKDKKNEKWDWASKGPHGFVAWVKDRLSGVPKHSGYDSAGLERAVSYLDKLDNEISKAMRLDLDGELDADKVEEVRAKIDDGISRLHDRLDKVKSVKKQKRSKKSDLEAHGLVKEAQKILGVHGVVITVPLLISRLARVCVNGTVSAGHDINDLYSRQVKQWKLTDREQAELQQLLFDMGYAIRQDRGFMPNEEVDISSSNNYDWSAQYRT